MIQPTEVSEVTNKVHDLIIQAETASTSGDATRLRAQALRYSCDFLERLAQDDISPEYVRVTQKGDQESRRVDKSIGGGAVELVSRDPKHFEDFLKREGELLRQSGMKSEVSERIVQRVHSEIGRILANSASGDDLTRAINSLRKHVCAQSAKLLAAFQRGRIGRTLVYGLGGIAMIAVNISAAGVLSAIGVGASAAIGGSLFKDAAKDFIDEISFNKS